MAVETEASSLFEAKWKLGAMRMQQARIPMEGIQLLAKTAREHPERPDAALKLGEMAMGTGQFERALGWYRLAKANTTGQEQAITLLRMSDAWFALEKRDSATWALNKIFEISTDSVLLRSVKQQLIELQNLSNK
ncbi:MAG: tol-pal system YbgF family protein [Flavobacteriales bacterium]